MAWVTFDQPRRRTGAIPTPAVTLSTKGVMAVNAAAYEAMGKPGYVTFLYDKFASIIGLRPSTRDCFHAYKVSFPPSSQAAYVSGTAFCKHFEIPLERRRHPAKWIDGVLHIDLKKEV